MALAAPGQLNLYEAPKLGSRSVSCFEILEKIGEGKFGQVYMAKEIETGEVVALKKICMENETEGFPITAIREIKLLKKLHHENVIKLKEIVTSSGCNMYNGSIFMVFEYMDHDLSRLSDGMRFSVHQIKCYMKQLLTGLHYCHINGVLHRDIKGSNLLINNNGILKIADFGLARSFCRNKNRNLTNKVITLWYRPPELLLGAKKYGPAVDMWSVGCILAELLCGQPILQGKNETDQLSKIFELCGSPDESNWPGVSKLPLYRNCNPQREMKRRFREYFKQLDKHALDLVEKMLVLDPSKRISAKDALDAEYFWVEPLPCAPCAPNSLPRYEQSHAFQIKMKRQQQRQRDGQGHLPLMPAPNPPPQFPVGPINYGAGTWRAGGKNIHPQNIPLVNAAQPGGYNANRGYAGRTQKQGGGYIANRGYGGRPQQQQKQQGGGHASQQGGSQWCSCRSQWCTYSSQWLTCRTSECGWRKSRSTRSQWCSCRSQWCTYSSQWSTCRRSECGWRKWRSIWSQWWTCRRSRSECGWRKSRSTVLIGTLNLRSID